MFSLIWRSHNKSKFSWFRISWKNTVCSIEMESNYMSRMCDDVDEEHWIMSPNRSKKNKPSNATRTQTPTSKLFLYPYIRYALDYVKSLTTVYWNRPHNTICRIRELITLKIRTNQCHTISRQYDQAKELFPFLNTIEWMCVLHWFRVAWKNTKGTAKPHTNIHRSSITTIDVQLHWTIAIQNRRMRYFIQIGIQWKTCKSSVLWVQLLRLFCLNRAKSMNILCFGDFKSIKDSRIKTTQNHRKIEQNSEFFFFARQLNWMMNAHYL